MVPEHLLKEQTKESKDQRRIVRLIRFLGTTNALLFIVLVLSWIWFLKINTALAVHAFADSFSPPLRVEMPLRVYSDVTPVSNGAILRQPVLTVYGKIKQYDGLMETLDGFTVTVAGDRVYPKQITGEFAEKLLLTPGQNVIDVQIRWNDIVQYRYQYTFTYIPEPVDPRTQDIQPSIKPVPAF